MHGNTGTSEDSVTGESNKNSLQTLLSCHSVNLQPRGHFNPIDNPWGVRAMLNEKAVTELAEVGPENGTVNLFPSAIF